MSVKHLWLRLQVGTLTRGPEKLLVRMTEDPGLLFQESAFCYYVASAQRQVGAMMKAGLTQHPSLGALRSVDA